MAEAKNTPVETSERISRQAPQLVTVLKEMKEGLDTVCSKVQALTAKVKAGHFPTADGISYLETKHLLLLNYCQSLVYYLLRKAKGLSIEGHPVVRSLVEIRLFLEKIRPIDKKLQYQIQKLTRDSNAASEKSVISEKGTDTTQKEDRLKYRPNPDALQPSITAEGDPNVYRPPKFAPASMDEDKMPKHEKNAKRKEKEELRRARQSPYITGLLNDLEGRPDEIKEAAAGTESRELTRYMEKMEERARQEEEMFSRVPLKKIEKQKMKHLKKSRNGLLGLTDSFYDEIKGLPLGNAVSEQSASFDNGNTGVKLQKKRKRRN